MQVLEGEVYGENGVEGTVVVWSGWKDERV